MCEAITDVILAAVTNLLELYSRWRRGLTFLKYALTCFQDHKNGVGSGRYFNQVLISIEHRHRLKKNNIFIS